MHLPGLMVSHYSTDFPLYVSKSLFSVSPVFRDLLARVRCVGVGSNPGVRCVGVGSNPESVIGLIS